MKTYRLAVCLSGQPRTWKLAAPSILKYFSVDRFAYANEPHRVEVDYFIHTWAANEWKGKITDGFVLERDSKDGLSEIETIFQPKKLQIDFPLGPALPFTSLFTSLRNSLLLKREYEQKQGFEYDIVVKSRLDVAFPPTAIFPTWYPTPLELVTSEPMGRIGFEFSYVNFNEIFFQGDSPTMDLVADFLYWYNEGFFGRENDATLHVGPGALLYRYLVEHNVHPGTPPVSIPYVIVRKQAQDRNLDIVRDFEQIKKIHQGYYRNM